MIMKEVTSGDLSNDDRDEIDGTEMIIIIQTLKNGNILNDGGNREQ